jgi:hypothetical protein
MLSSNTILKLFEDSKGRIWGAAIAIPGIISRNTRCPAGMVDEQVDRLLNLPVPFAGKKQKSPGGDFLRDRF